MIMKKKILALLITISIIFLTACTKENQNIFSGLTEENKPIYEFLINNVLTTSNTRIDNYYIFDPSGVILIAYPPDTETNLSQTILFKGTWKLEGNNIITTTKEQLKMKVKEDGKYEVEHIKEGSTTTYENMNIEKDFDGSNYIKGNKTLYIKNNPKEKYVEKLKEYLFIDIDKLEIEKIIEAYNAE